MNYKAKLIKYDMVNDEVNNLYTLIDDLVIIDADKLTDKQIVKCFNNQYIDSFMCNDKIKIDFRSISIGMADDMYIEIENKSGQFVGRVELEVIS